MDRRKILILAAPVGLLLGAAFWIASGGGDGRAVAAQETRLSSLPRLRQAVMLSRGDAIAAQGLLSSPLFDPAVVIREMAIRLEGLARTPGRAAALLSIDGAPAQWLDVGRSVAGLTLLSLTGSGAIIDTGEGGREVALGAGSAPSAAPPAATSPSDAAQTPPPGYRGPVPPASAPGGVP